jgi:hypothetical protein
MEPSSLNKWRSIIRQILTDLAAIPFPEVVTMSAKTVFDEASDVYLVVVEGWQDVKRLHGCLAHVEIKGDKTWIQQDGTERGIATELMAAGIPQDCIVLGFKSPYGRRYAQFAVA